MVGKTHVMIGLATLAGAEAATGLVQPHPVKDIPVGPFLCIIAVIVGALAPDIDAEESQIKYEMGEAGLALSTWLQSFGVEHRGLTHYGLTGLIVTVSSGLLGWWLGYPDVGLAFGLGYLSHILADSLTLTGTPLLWPLQKEQNFHLLPAVLRIRTGGPVEPLIFIAVSILLLFLLPALVLPEWIKTLRHGL
ncbi:MAG: metal-dependent hydrolase [Anaerolineae bacterium]|nr:metal-dependent hydrolase [Anaerolineae bacterium]